MSKSDKKPVFDEGEECERIVSEYINCRSLFDDYIDFVRSILSRILKKNQFNHLITHRSKDPESLKRKLVRVDENNKILIRRILDPKDKEYDDWKKIKDLAGLRVIFMVESELQKFLRVISEELGSAIEIKDASHDSYHAIHIIFSPDSARGKLAEYKDFVGLRCEIQLRTFLQHAWSEIDHKISYKPADIYSNFADKKIKLLIKKKLRAIKTNYIDKAEVELDVLYQFYRKKEEGAKILDAVRLRNVSMMDSNGDIFNEVSYLAESLSSCNYILPLDVDIYQLIKMIFAKAKSNSVTSGDNDSRTNQKTVFDVAIKLIEVLKVIRYIDVVRTVESLKQFETLSNPNINLKIKETLKETVKYEYHLIKKFGLSIQDVLLGYIEKDRNLDFDSMITITSEMLDPSFEGSDRPDVNTISWMSGPLPVVLETKEIRRRTIEFLFSKMDGEHSMGNIKQIVQTLGNACRLPDQDKFGEDFLEMVAIDIKLLVDNYEKRMFNDQGNLAVALPIAQEVVSQLFIRHEGLRGRVKEAQTIREKIRADKRYEVFELFSAGNAGYIEEEDFHKAEEKKLAETNKFYHNINNNNALETAKLLNSVAIYYDPDEQWQWRGFGDLLCRIAMEKPDVAGVMLDHYLPKDESLVKNFIGDFLLGFRKSNNYSSWSKYLKIIIAKKSIEMIRGVLYSFWGLKGKNFIENVRDGDITLLEDIAQGRGEFIGIEESSDNDQQLHHALFNALICLNNKDPKKIEEIISAEIRKNPQYINLFISMINVGIVRKEISIRSWDQDNLRIIINYLADVDNISNNMDAVLEDLETSTIMEIFERRIKKRVEDAANRKPDDYSYLEYDAIPSYLNPKLIEKMQNDTAFREILEDWINKMNPKEPLYGMLVAEAVQKIGGKPFNEIQESMMKDGKDSELEKIIELMWGVNSPSIDFCFEIVKKTDNPKILQRLENRIFATGVVSGEYGICDAYASKIDRIKKIERENIDNERVKKFAQRLVKDLSAQILAEKRRVEESMMLRKIDFES